MVEPTPPSRSRIQDAALAEHEPGRRDQHASGGGEDRTDPVLAGGYSNRDRDEELAEAVAAHAHARRHAAVLRRRRDGNPDERHRLGEPERQAGDRHDDDQHGKREGRDEQRQHETGDEHAADDDCGMAEPARRRPRNSRDTICEKARIASSTPTICGLMPRSSPYAGR